LLSEISWKRWTLLFASAAALFFLYFFGLTRAGLLGPDEPRYAAIGAAMAHSGDWVTPRLWGIPWFEKPALLYWMTATAFKAGLDEDLAPRLPVAILSAGFLIFSSSPCAASSESEQVATQPRFWRLQQAGWRIATAAYQICRCPQHSQPQCS